jgi:DNA-binding Lrp family transcriptional regulator
MLDLNDAIILACAAQGGAMASVATEQTGLTRVAVSRRIKKLADSGYLQRHGTGTRQTYSLGDKRFWLGVQQRESILQRGGEMAVWEQRLAPLLTDLKPNVKSLVNTAFTKMLNNALDHSNGLQVLMGMHLQDGQLQMVVADDGEGLFCKIAESAHLFDERLAILELAKGKFTTAAQGHSGMGIFVLFTVVSPLFLLLLLTYVLETTFAATPVLPLLGSRPFGPEPFSLCSLAIAHLPLHSFQPD